MPSTLNFRAPKLSILAGDEVEVDRDDALRLGMSRAMKRGRQSVRPAFFPDSGIVAWLVQDVRGIAPKPEPHEDPWPTSSEAR